MGAMSGYIAVRVLAEGKPFDAWQNIQDGEVLGYLDAKGQGIELPPVCEMQVISGDLVEEIPQ